LITRAAIKNENLRLQSNEQVLEATIIDVSCVRGGCKLAVELCAHDFDSASALAAREMPSKECHLRRAIARELSQNL
jgi:hypothetical protein